MFGTISPQPSGKGSGHVAQVRVVELGVGAVELAPPSAQAAAGLGHGKVSVEHDAINAIVSAFQELRVVSRKVIGWIHAHSLTPAASPLTGCAASFSQPQSGTRRRF